MELIKQLANHVNAGERENFVIFGSAAICLNGVDLQREINDLDVFVSETTFNNLKSCFTEQFKKGGDGPVPFLSPETDIEILKSFPGVQFDQVHRNARPLPQSQGFLVGVMDDLIKWKETQGRPKDLRDLEIIKEWIKNHPQ